MPKYVVEIREINTRQAVVEAKDEEEAAVKAEMFWNDNYDLFHDMQDYDHEVGFVELAKPEDENLLGECLTEDMLENAKPKGGERL
jgi:hypothetical protein